MGSAMAANLIKQETNCSVMGGGGGDLRREQAKALESKGAVSKNPQAVDESCEGDSALHDQVQRSMRARRPRGRRFARGSTAPNLDRFQQHR